MITRAQSLALLLLGATLHFTVAQELVVVVESPAFTLDTRLVGGSDTAALVVTAASQPFTLDTRFTAGNPTLAALVVTAESAAFALDTRLARTIDALIVQAISPAFTLNTMWVGIQKITRTVGSPVELYWTTNAPGFHLQVADPPLGPSALWLDVTNSVSESDGLYRVLLDPAGSDRYYRLKL